MYGEIKISNSIKNERLRQQTWKWQELKQLKKDMFFQKKIFSQRKKLIKTFKLRVYI